MDTEVSITIDGHPYYRGKDVIALAQTENFERVCALLWQSDTPNPFGAIKPRPDVNFPGGPRTRILSMLSRRLEEDALSDLNSARNLKTEAASVLNELVDVVTNGGPRLFIHQRLARAWKVYDHKDVDLLRTALVLSADASLDEGIFAARVAASSLGPLAVPLMAGFAALTGPRLGGRISRAEAYVTQVRRQGNPALVARALLNQGHDLPGFEREAVASEQACARALIEAAGHMGDDLKAILKTGEDLTGRAVNLSLALALVGRHMDLPREAPLALYGIGRSAGLLAHAIEQMTAGAAPKARLRYIGAHPLEGS